MYELFYRVEANAICLIILSWVVFQSRIGRDLQTRNILFRKAVYSTATIILLETIEMFITGRGGNVFFIIHNVLSVFYLCMTALVAYYWFIYTLYYVNGRVRILKVWRILLMLPLWIFFALVGLSPFTHWIFCIDKETNTFLQGKFYVLQMLITYGFFSAGGTVALVGIFGKKTNHSKSLTMFSFVIMPLLGGILHIFLPLAKIVWPALAVGELFVFCDFRFRLILMDSLTGMNNRRSFDLLMRSIASENEKDTKLLPVLFMMDVNLFKHINDQFGHSEGDAALEQTAQILKTIFKGLEAYLCRYGGDEFAAVYCCTDDEALKIKNAVYQAFEEYNGSSKKKYRLSMSVGYARLTAHSKTGVERMISEADEAMYREKRARKENSL